MTLLMTARRRGGAAGGGGSSTTINAEVFRWDGNSGDVAVVGAWPLKPGALFSTNLTKFVVRNESGIEVAIGISPCRGTFPDGSLRSLRFHFVAPSLANDTIKAYTIEVGGATRTTANDLPYTETIFTSATATVPAMNHRAVMIPANSQYWCDTFAALVPLIPESTEVADAAHTFFRTAGGTPSTLGYWASALDATDYGAANGASTWEHLHGYHCAAIRAANQSERIAHYKRFYETLVNQCGGDDYYRIGTNITPAWTKLYGGVDSSLPAATDPNNVMLGSEPKSGQAIGWTAGYYATGWRQPYFNVDWMANWANSETTYANAKNSYINTSYGVRYNMQWHMQFIACAYVMNATIQVGGGFGAGRDNTVLGYSDMQWMLDALAEFILTTANSYARMDGLVGIRNTVRDDGGLGSTNTPEFPIFQGMAAVKFLSFFYDNIYPDSRIPGWIKAWADFIIGQTVDMTMYYGQPYFSSDTPATGFDFGPWYLPFFSKMFAWVYASTGNTTYKTWALRAANTRELENPSRFGPTVKGFGEYYSGDQQSSKALIDLGALRTFTGAHPTMYVAPITYTS